MSFTITQWRHVIFDDISLETCHEQQQLTGSMSFIMIPHWRHVTYNGNSPEACHLQWHPYLRVYIRRTTIVNNILPHMKIIFFFQNGEQRHPPNPRRSICIWYIIKINGARLSDPFPILKRQRKWHKEMPVLGHFSQTENQSIPRSQFVIKHTEFHKSSSYFCLPFTARWFWQVRLGILSLPCGGSTNGFRPCSITQETRPNQYDCPFGYRSVA